MSFPGGAALSILTYHAVTSQAPPLDDWCFMPARSFAAQMAFLHRFGFDVPPLGEAIPALRAGQLNRRSVAITFDDGYRNNITTALPILERFGFPATIFVVSGLIDSRKALWPNRVVAAVETSAKPSINFQGTVLSLGSREERAQTARDLQFLIKSAFAANPDDGAEEVERLCDTAIDPDFGAEHDFAMLDERTIRDAAGHGLIEFGAHTVTHPLLAQLATGDVEAEVLGSVARVAQAAGRPCRQFSYPNGRFIDFDSRAVSALERAGVECAVTTLQDRARPDDDPLLLPRWDIGDFRLARFAGMVSGLYPFRSGSGAVPRPALTSRS